jgi:hypothetical protein
MASVWAAPRSRFMAANEKSRRKAGQGFVAADGFGHAPIVVGAGACHEVVLLGGVGRHRGAALLERHCHLRLPPPYKATGTAGPFQWKCQRKTIRHFAWSDHFQCSARLGKLTDQA